jgi:hypothetical protein
MYSDSRLIFLQISRKAKIFVLLAIPLLMYMLYLFAGSPSGDPVYYLGTVQSSGVMSVSRLGGGNAGVTSVKLADGRVVIAYVSRDMAPVSPGDKVRVVEQKAKLFSPSYGITERLR